MINKDKRDLEAFCQIINDLENSNAIKKCSDNTRVLLCLREENGKPINYVKNIPEEEDKDRLIRIMRQLLMHKEKLNYYHICNILLKDNLKRETAQKLKSYWTEILKPSQKQIGLFYDDVMLTNEEIINIFLYGGFIHTRDDLLIKKYQNFQSTMGELFDFWMYNVVFDLADIAIRTKNLINSIKKERSKNLSKK